MKWKKYTIETTTQAEDLVCGMLMELGIEGVEIQDKQPITEEEKRQMYIDILPELPEDDGVAYVSFYMDDTEDENILLQQVQEELKEMASYAPVGSGNIVKDYTEDKDWVNNWKQFFKPFTVDDLLIKPSWHEMSTEEKQQYPLVIEIDPGTAFGTGMHETTQLVLRQLRKYVNEDTRVFDVGCGSGILAILALKLGAAHVTAMDIDPAAVEATFENMESNGISRERFEAYCGNLLEGTQAANQAGYGCYDLVAANILADIIIPLCAVVGPHLKENGLFVTSGILNTKEAAVIEAMEQNGFEIVEVTRQNDWVSVTGRKPGQKDA